MAGLQPITFLFNAAALGVGLLRPPKRVVLGAITVDATIQEQHNADADVTEHPVEQGANITDHIRPKLKRYTIDGVISNTPPDDQTLSSALGLASVVTGITLPTGAIQGVVSLIKNGGIIKRAENVFNELQKLVDAAQPFKIVTPLRTYEQMAIESLNVVREASVGDGLRFMAQCKEIRTVESATVDVQLPAVVQGAKDLGHQPTIGGGGGLLDKNNTVLEGWFGKGLGSIGLPQPIRNSMPGGDT